MKNGENKKTIEEIMKELTDSLVEKFKNVENEPITRESIIAYTVAMMTQRFQYFANKIDDLFNIEVYTVEDRHEVVAKDIFTLLYMNGYMVYPNEVIGLIEYKTVDGMTWIVEEKNGRFYNYCKPEKPVSYIEFKGVILNVDEEGSKTSTNEKEG